MRRDRAAAKKSPTLPRSDVVAHCGVALKRVAVLLEDETTILVVRTALECAGLQFDRYPTLPALLRAVRRDDHLAVVIDTTVASFDCAALLAWRRHWRGADVPVVALGADDGQTAMRLLDLGVDDFVAKPVRGAELLARLRAAGRRGAAAHEADGPPSVAGCSIDRAASAIVSDSSRVALTARELALARVLFENVGQVVTRTYLSQVVWGQDEAMASRSIEQHVYQLRRKIKRCAGEVLSLRSIYGSGYLVDVAEGQVPPMHWPAAASSPA